MTQNVTLRLDEALLQKARHVAVDHRMSLSAWVASVVAEAVKRETSYEAAKVRALERLDRGFEMGGDPLSREAVHER